MARLISALLLLTLLLLDINGSEVTTEPSGPQMYEDLCHISPSCFGEEDLPCHRIPTNDSVNKTTTKDPFRCPKDRRMHITPFALMLGQKVCAGDNEGRTAMKPPDDPQLGSLYSNIALHQACVDGGLCMVQFILSQGLADISIGDQYGRTPVMVAALNGQVLVFDFLVGQGCDLSVVDDNNDTVLHVACEGGSTDIVIKLVNQNCDVESRGKYGWTPVMRSVFHGHIDVFYVLVSKGCNLTIVDDYMNNILHVACMGGHIDIVKHIIAQRTFSIDVRGSFRRTPIMIAAYSGHENVVDFLWSEGVNSSVEDKHRNTILHLACMGGHVDVVKQILLEISRDSRGYQGRTPVMAAACSGQKQIVHFLVSKGCKLSETDEQRNSILHVACMGGHVDVVKYILSLKKIDFNSRGAYGVSPVMTAAYNGHRNVVTLLVRKGCNLSAVDNQGNKVLHQACIGGHVKVVKYILSLQKIDMNSKGGYGFTPVMFAAYNGHEKVVTLLVRKGCNLHAVDDQGNNVLHRACSGGHVEVVKYILSLQKIDINSKGAFGRTPEMVATYNGHKNVIFLLKSRGCKLSVIDEQGNNILHVACMGGHVDVVKYILSLQKIEVDSVSDTGRTPAMFAAYYGHKNVISLLVMKGCKLSETDEQGNNILHQACMGGRADVVKYILSLQKIGINSKGHFGWTPVMSAAYNGHRNVVTLLVGKGCNLYTTGKQGNNILHVACMGGHVDVVRYILSLQKIEVDSVSGTGRTPAMFAAYYGHKNVFSLLVMKGCKLSETDEQGNNILHQACMAGHADVVKYILSLQKIGINSKGHFGWTPVMSAAYNGHRNVVTLLVGKGCNLYTTGKKGNNVLHFACMGGHVDVVKYILSLKKIDIKSKGGFGRTPEMAAAYNGHKNVIFLLKSRGFKLSEIDEQGNNILHVACMGGHVDVVKYILSLKKIDINSRGASGRTPSMAAAFNGNKNVISLLISKGSKMMVVDNDGNNILHIACARGDTEMVKYLMKLRSIVEMKRGRNRSNRTPAQLAVATRHGRIAALLKAGG